MVVRAKDNNIFINGTPRVSLRLGRAHVLTTHCVVIHYARVATLRRPLQSIKATPNNKVRTKQAPPLCKGRGHFRKKMTDGLSYSGGASPSPTDKFHSSFIIYHLSFVIHKKP